MTFPKGQWATEHGVKVTLNGITKTHHCGSDDADESRAEWLELGATSAEVVTRQAFYGEWQPLSERTGT